LVCGPFGALVLAGMWARGGYSMRARLTAIAVWGGLMVLLCVAGAVTIQSQMSALLADPTRFGVPPAGAPVAGTPLIFPTPPVVAPAATQAPPAAKPAAAPSPPPIGAVPGETATRPSPIVIAPPPPTLISSPGGSPPAGDKLRVHDTGPSGANMRDRPGASGAVVKTAPDGAILQVIGPDQPADGRTWRHVKDESGAEGWVAADFVEPAP